MSNAEVRPYRPLQDGLRAAGHYLDAQHRRLVSLSVITPGIVLSLAAQDLHRGADAVLLTHDDLLALSRQARAARGTGLPSSGPDPLYPTGYEDFLRAVGLVADQEQWTELHLVRLGETVVLQYGSRRDRGEAVLTAAEVQALLNHAFNQRASVLRAQLKLIA